MSLHSQPPVTLAACLDASDDALALVERCRASDEHAWRELYDAHFEFVFRVARRLGTPPSEAEDVAQEVFVVAHRKLEAFTGGRLSTWLYRICVNLVLDRQKRSRVRSAFVALRVWFGASPVDSPEREVERNSAQKSVERVLREMKPKKREVFALYELEGLSTEGIAERLGCPVGTVSTRLHHARKEFLQIAARLGCLEDVEQRQ